MTIFECDRSGARREVDDNQRKYDLSFKESCYTIRVKLKFKQNFCFIKGRLLKAIYGRRLVNRPSPSI